MDSSLFRIVLINAVEIAEDSMHPLKFLTPEHDPGLALAGKYDFLWVGFSVVIAALAAKIDVVIKMAVNASNRFIVKLILVFSY